MLKLTQNHGVRTISLNRPERRNAFNAPMIADLTKAFRDVAADQTVRAVVLTAEGDSFCAGGDLAWMKASATFTREENVRDAERLHEMFWALREVPVPVIGRIFGHCFGGGLGLVAACDVVAADAATQFCFAEVKWGIVPAVISPFVVEKAAPHCVREWTLTAKVFDASEAARGGLVHLVGTRDEVDQGVECTLRQVLAAAPEAVRATKHLHQSLSGVDWPEAKRLTTDLIAEHRASEEGQYGLSCFLNKTKPDWTHGRAKKI